MSATEEAAVVSTAAGTVGPTGSGPVAVVWCRQVDNEAESPGYTTIPDQFPGRPETLDIIRVVGNLTINVADTSDYWTPGPPAPLSYYPNLFVYPAYGGRYMCVGRMFLSTEDRPRLGMKTFVLDTQQLLQSGDFGGSLLRWHATMGPTRSAGGRSPPMPSPNLYPLLGEGLLFQRGESAPVVVAASTEWPACLEVVSDLVRNMPASLLMLGAILVFPYFLPQPKTNMAEFTEQIPLALAVMRVPPSEAAGDRHAKRMASWESTKVSFRDLTDGVPAPSGKGKDTVPLVLQYLRDHNPSKLTPIAQRVDLVEVPKVTAVLLDADRASGKDRRKEMWRIGAAMVTAALQLGKVKGRIVPAPTTEVTRRAQSYIQAEVPKPAAPVAPEVGAAVAGGAAAPAATKPLPTWLSKPPVAPLPSATPGRPPAREVVPVSTSDDPSLLPRESAPAPLSRASLGAPPAPPAPPAAAPPAMPSLPAPGSTPSLPSKLDHAPSAAVGPAPAPIDIERVVRAELDRRGFSNAEARLNEMLQATENRLAKTITEMDTRWQGKLGPTAEAESQRTSQLEAIRARIEERHTEMRRLIDTRLTSESAAREEEISRRLAAEKEALEATWSKQAASERAALDEVLTQRAETEKAERDAVLTTQIAAARTAWDGEWSKRLAHERTAIEEEFKRRVAAERKTWDSELSQLIAAERTASESDGSKRTASERAAVEAGLARRLTSEKEALEAEWSKRLGSEREALDADWSKRLAEAQVAFDAAIVARLATERRAMETDWTERLAAERETLDQTWSERLAEEKAALEADWSGRFASERGAMDEGWSKRLATEKGVTEAELAKRLQAVEDRIRGLGSLDDVIDRRVRGSLDAAGLPREAGGFSAFADGLAGKIQSEWQAASEANAQALETLDQRMEERWKLLAALTGAEVALSATRGSAAPESLPAQLDRRFAEREAAITKSLNQLRQEVLARAGADAENRLTSLGDGLRLKIEEETESRVAAMENERGHWSTRLQEVDAKLRASEERAAPMEARLRQEIGHQSKTIQDAWTLQARALQDSLIQQAKTLQETIGRVDAEGRQRTQSYTDLRVKQLVDRERETSQTQLGQLRQELQGAMAGLLDANRLELVLKERFQKSDEKLRGEIGALVEERVTAATEAVGEHALSSLAKVEAVERDLQTQTAELVQIEERLKGELIQIDRRLVMLTERMVPVIRKTWIRIAEMDREADAGSPGLEMKIDELRREMKDEMRRLSDDHADRTREVRQRLEDRLGQQEQVWGIMARGLAEMRNRRLRESSADRDDELPSRSDDLDDDPDARPRRRRPR
ncbi:MAG: hypothetical protein L3K03_08885 [Thermoplasmata archaeon]|nr:hypothetical protein [Thermoplasmata archaeon]